MVGAEDFLQTLGYMEYRAEVTEPSDPLAPGPEYHPWTIVAIDQWHLAITAVVSCRRVLIMPGAGSLHNVTLYHPSTEV